MSRHSALDGATVDAVEVGNIAHRFAALDAPQGVTALDLIEGGLTAELHTAFFCHGAAGGRVFQNPLTVPFRGLGKVKESRSARRRIREIYTPHY